jgi:hypothetical protein
MKRHSSSCNSFCPQSRRGVCRTPSSTTLYSRSHALCGFAQFAEKRSGCGAKRRVLPFAPRKQAKANQPQCCAHQQPAADTNVIGQESAHQRRSYRRKILQALRQRDERMTLYQGTMWRRLCRNGAMNRARNRPVKAGVASSGAVDHQEGHTIYTSS